METDNTLKPKDLDPALLKRLEDQYGPMDMENDFFDRTLLNYYKTTDVDKETNSSTQKTIKLPSLGDSLKGHSDSPHNGGGGIMSYLPIIAVGGLAAYLLKGKLKL